MDSNHPGVRLHRRWRFRRRLEWLFFGWFLWALLLAGLGSFLLELSKRREAGASTPEWVSGSLWSSTLLPIMGLFGLASLVLFILLGRMQRRARARLHAPDI